MSLTDHLSLRQLTDQDETFMRDLYRTSRDFEFNQVDWPQETKHHFLDSQFEQQQRSYRAQYPEALWQLVVLRKRPIGRLITAERPAEIALIDITLLPKLRGKGIGTTLIQQLMNEATAQQKPLRLYVIPLNHSAIRLYRRLGFRIIGDIGTHLHMEWPANQ